MQILKLNSLSFEKSKIVQIVKFLKSNKIVVLPTDTCYGIMGKATDREVVRKIFKIKGRAFKKPLSCIFWDIKMIKRFAKVDWQNEKLMRKFLPGPVTFILPKKNLPDILTAGQKFVGVRIPKNKIIAAVMARLNFPITATSANISGKKEPYSAFDILVQYKNRKFQPDLIVDAGKLRKVKPSTVVKIENSQVRILRLGPILENQIKI
ncbi:MAG: L-threonylcarbamoyladenylate synthase [Patescibacteria group bacterium]